MKKVTMMLTLILAIAANVFASTANVIGGPIITTQDKANAQQFVVLKGSDRLEAYKKIEKLILVSDRNVINQPDLMGVAPSSKSDVQSLMGLPDEITDGGFWVYNLKDNTSSCKVVIGFDKIAQVIFCTIKDCD